MQLSQEINHHAYLIQAYGEFFIKINNKKITHSCIISGKQIIEPWNVTDITQLKEENFHDIVKLNPTVLLIGLRKKVQFPQKQLLTSLHSTSIEMMTTASACRTYNVLSTEGRRVAAAFII